MGFSFAILHCSGNKDCFIDKFAGLHRDNANLLKISSMFLLNQGLLMSPGKLKSF